MDVKDIILAASIAKGAGGGSGGGVTKEYVDTQVGAVSERVGDIEDVIPSTATPQNPLATTADVSGTAITSTSTTSPLTDSADGYVQGVTVKGRSEVVDGEIKSVGEGYAVVGLGTLNWSYNTSNTYFYADMPTNAPEIIRGGAPFICAQYEPYIGIDALANMQGTLCNSVFTAARKVLWIKDNRYTDAETFKSAMNCVILAYPLADPSQGNAIAVKTDDGSGINGTMATLTTALPLRSVSDTVRDKLICTADVKQVETVCGEVNLGTTDNWGVAGEAANTYYLTLNEPTLEIKPYTTNVLLSTRKYQYVSTSQIATDKSYTIQNRNILIHDNDYTDITSFKSSLSGVKLVYELATPTETPLTSAEKSAFRGLKTYDSTTNITITDSPDFELDYLKNTENGQAVADIQTDLQGQIDGLKIKTLTYTGTGTSTNAITFPEIPVCIFSFVNKQRDSYGNFNWTNPFTWNSPYITIYYAGSSSGSQSTAVSYTGNTLTLTGSDAGLAMNRSDTEYNIYYI